MGFLRSFVVVLASANQWAYANTTQAVVDAVVFRYAQVSLDIQSRQEGPNDEEGGAIGQLGAREPLFP